MQSKPLTSSKEFHDQYLGTFEMPRQSELLTQFYRAYAAWIDDGAPRRVLFRRDAGLCRNVMIWAEAIGKEGLEIRLLRDELRTQLKQANLDMNYPFSPKDAPFGVAHYYHSDEQPNQTCYLNEDRIKWAREHAE
jgi:hypothetical protein